MDPMETIDPQVLEDNFMELMEVCCLFLGEDAMDEMRTIGHKFYFFSLKFIADEQHTRSSQLFKEICSCCRGT